jgi:folate-binding protein YgfZ
MYINISTSRAIFRWRPACWLKVGGEDAASFLQGQFTNDLQLLEATPAVYGLWLTVKGKVLADSFVLRGRATNEFWVGSYFSPAGVIRDRLENHIVADDVTIDDETDQWSGVSLFGGDPPDHRPDKADVSWLVFPGRRSDGPSFECVFRIADGEPEWVSAFAATVLGEADQTRRRIAAGIPAVPVDIGPQDLPNEAGLEAAAISYTKGCYLGQEVMARLKAMGQVRRRLWRVRGNGDTWPTLPAAVFADQRQVGELRSAAREEGIWRGFAMVTLLHVAPQIELSFAPGAPPAMRLEALP